MASDEETKLKRRLEELRLKKRHERINNVRLESLEVLANLPTPEAKATFVSKMPGYLLPDEMPQKVVEELIEGLVIFGKYELAAHYSKSIENYENAINYYIKTSLQHKEDLGYSHIFVERAAEIAREELHNPKREIAILAEHGLVHKAIERASEIGDLEMGLRIAEENFCWRDAAKFASKLGQKQKCKTYQQILDLFTEAQCLDPH